MKSYDTDYKGRGSVAKATDPMGTEAGRSPDLIWAIPRTLLLIIAVCSVAFGAGLARAASGAQLFGLTGAGSIWIGKPGYTFSGTGFASLDPETGQGIALSATNTNYSGVYSS